MQFDRLPHTAVSRMVLFVCSLSLGCAGGGTDPLSPSSVTVVSGDAQSLYVGGNASQPLVVVVKNASGAPIANTSVEWTVTKGGGTLDSVATTTDASGNARVVYLSSDTAGTATITAVTGSRSAELTVTLLADTVGTLTAFAGNGTALLIGFPVTLIAKAGDKFGNPIAGIAVTWSAPTGILQNTTSTTGANGQATTVLTVGPSAGSYTVTAASRFNTTTFMVTAVPPVSP